MHALTTVKPIPDGTSILADLNNEKSANSKLRYELTKLLDVFMTRKIAALPGARDVVVNMANPGLCITEITRGFTGLAKLGMKLIRAASQAAEAGARNFAWACTNDTPPGAYVSVTSVRPTNNYSRSEEAIKFEDQLWDELVEEWVKVAPNVRQIVA